MRLFTAIDLPDEVLQNLERSDDAARDIVAAFPGARG